MGYFMSVEQENRFKELQARNKKVTEGAMKINTQIEHARETRAKLKEAAQKKFNESDLDKIKEMAALWDKENDAINDKLEQDINRVEAAVEAKMAIMKQINQKD